MVAILFAFWGPPVAKQDLTVELFYSGTWNTVPAYVRNPVTITRERPVGSEPTPFTVTVTLQGLHNPKNPFSPLYGVAGQNTPIRFTLGSDVRFYGEVASWSPQRSVNYDATAGKGDAWTEVQATGILRRLGQGADPVRSALHRTMIGVTPGDFVPLAYYPLEDGENATQFASATPGVAPLDLGGWTLAVDDSLPGSLPLPSFDGLAYATGPLPVYTDTGQWVAQIVIKAMGNGGSAVSVYSVETTQGKIAVGIDADLETAVLAWFNTSGVVIDQEISGAFPGQLADQWVSVVAMSTQVGGGSPDTATIKIIDIDGATIWETTVDTTVGFHGPATRVNVSGAISSTGQPGTYGHFAIFTDPAFTLGTDDLANVQAMNGWAGEQAHERLERLCREERIPITIDGSVSQYMGAQPQETLTALFAECERTDDGILFEPRSSYGLIYRCGRQRYSRPVVLELDYAAHDVAPPLLPVLDDLASRNDITVKRRDGASARAVLETGPLSVQEPPDGIGRYTTQVDVNTETDGVLVDHAYWHLHKGTIDGLRYAFVTVDLDARPSLAADATMVSLGDVITIANLPADEHPGLARLVVTGYVETIGSHRRKITYSCIPAATYDVGVWGADAATSGSRWGVWTTFLAEDLTTSETAADVTTGTDVWATTASHPGLFPAGGGAGISVVIGGLTYLCTAITGTHPNLTLTLVRLADDKTHSTGDQVWIADTFNWGI